MPGLKNYRVHDPVVLLDGAGAQRCRRSGVGARRSLAGFSPLAHRLIFRFPALLQEVRSGHADTNNAVAAANSWTTTRASLPSLPGPHCWVQEGVAAGKRVGVYTNCLSKHLTGRDGI